MPQTTGMGIPQWSRKARYLAAGVVLIACAVFAADARNRATLFHPSGAVAEGSAFGVRVGDERSHALSRLAEAGFSQWKIGVPRLNGCAGETALYGYDLSWRHGVVCVGLRKGRVQSLAWDFNLLSP